MKPPSRSLRTTTRQQRRRRQNQNKVDKKPAPHSYSTRKKAPVPQPQPPRPALINSRPPLAHNSSTSNRPPPWTHEERIVIHILHKKYSRDEPDKRVAIFNKVFKQLHEELGIPDGREKKSISGQYGDRNKKGRRVWWKGVVDGDVDGEAWEGWREKIREAEGELGFDVVEGDRELTLAGGDEEMRDEEEDSTLTELVVAGEDVEGVDENGRRQDSLLSDSGASLSSLTSVEDGQINGDEPVGRLTTNVSQEEEDSTLTDLVSLDEPSTAHPPKRFEQEDSTLTDLTVEHEESPDASEQPAQPNGPTDTEHDTTQHQAAPLSYDQPPLPTLHSTDCLWASNQAYISTHLPLPPTTTQPLPQTGKVHRVLDKTNIPRDYIIHHSFNTPLNHNTNTSDAYPFVHSLDLLKRNKTFIFSPQPNVAFDRHFSPVTESWPRNVVYGDGKVRITEVCVFRKCGVCAVEALARKRRATGDGEEEEDGM